MDLPRFESEWGYLAGALALLELTVFLLLIYMARLRRKARSGAANSASVEIVSPRGGTWVSHEIERLRLGEKLNESRIKQMSAKDRALFEVSVIDVLNKCSREDQHRVRSALIKYGYDEHCARRVMDEELSNRVRACALLSLLRPQWRDQSIELGPTDEHVTLVQAAGRTTGPLNSE
jgi:hypothetical protein